MIETNRFLYRWDIVLYIPGREKPIETLTDYLSLRLDYDEKIFPVIKAKLTISASDLPEIARNKKRIYAGVTIRVEERGRETDKEEVLNHEASDEIVDEYILHKGMYLPLFVESSFPNQYSEQGMEEDEPVEEGNEEGSTYVGEGDRASTPQLVAFLYNTDSLRINKERMFNFVSTSDISTVMLYIINQLPDEIHSVIMDPPSNEQKYPEIRSPLYNLRNTIMNLQKRYGIYDSGLQMFMMFGTLYILNKYKMDYEYADGDYSRVRLKINEGSDLSQVPSVDIHKPNKETIEYEVGTPIKEIDISTLMGEKSGDSVIFSNAELVTSAVSYKDREGPADYKNPGVMIARHDETHKETGNKVKFDYDELNNPFNFVSEMNKSSPGHLIGLGLQAVDLKSFYPNKIFDLTVENDDYKNQKHRGEYRIYQADLSFRKANMDEDHMFCNASVVLSRKKERA